MRVASVSCIGIGAGLCAGTLMQSIRHTYHPSDRGRVPFFEVSTKGTVLLAAILFTGISLLMQTDALPAAPLAATAKVSKRVFICRSCDAASVQ